MKVFMNSKIVNPQITTVVEMGLGIPISDPKIKKYQYKIYMDFSELTHLIEELYDEFVVDTKEDDEKYGDTCEDIQSTGYAKFSEVSKNDKKILLTIIKDYLYPDLLDSCFDDNDPSKCKYVINTMEELTIENGIIVISGEAFKAVSTAKKYWNWWKSRV